MDELQALVGLGGAAVVVALVQAVKPVVTDTRWHPLVALACGVLWNLGLALALGRPLPAAAVLGVTTGLVAAGAYSGVRAAAGR